MNYLLIGSGNISNTYLSAIQKIDNSQIVASVSRSGKKGPKNGQRPVYASITEAVEEGCSFDAVIITTPNGLHHVSAIEAARHKKHVLTEKPLDISRESMISMIEAAQKADIVLAVSYQRRTSPDNLAIKKLCDQGAFGKIYAVDLSCKFYRSEEYYNSAPYRGGLEIDGGGPFIQQACHNIDLYQWFFGMPCEVQSMTTTLAHSIEAEDHGAAILRHDSGLIGTIIASTLAKPGFPARFEVHTEKGFFSTHDDVITHWDIEGISKPLSKKADYEQKGASSHIVSDTSQHEAILQDFQSAITNGHPPVATAASAQKTTELILQIYKK